MTNERFAEEIIALTDTLYRVSYSILRDKYDREDAVQEALRGCALEDMDAEAFQMAKRYGLSDAEIAVLTGSDERTVRACRKILGVRPAFKTVDTCAAEFPTKTAYHYKTYDADETEVAPKTRKRAMILGAGPNRIGQGIEFDYCCVHASYALADAGYETIMVNCNPETVSTDYDTSDMLFFEPLTYEDVMDVIDATDPDGVVVTLGGQTPLKLARALEEAGVPIMGTSPDAIDLAEDRDRFAALLDSLDIAYPRSAMASGLDEARAAARAGLLHDLFLYDWHFHAKETGNYFHGLTHPRRALENAQRLFSLTDREKNIILRHMWPLTVTPPKYREAYVIVMFDKYCSLMETFHKPVMELMEYQELTADLKKGFAAQ